jgi:hypothetical protein
MSEADRYKALLESAVETAYYDELQKLGYVGVMSQVPRWAQIAIKAGKPTAAILPALAEAGVRAGGTLGRFGARQRYALGLGVKGAKPGTPEHASRLAELGLPGAKPVDPLSVRAKAITQEQEKWLPRLKRYIKGEEFPTEKALAAREAKLLAKAEGERELHELTKGTIPGVAKALATKPIKTMGAGLKAMPGYEKAMMAGAGGMTAHELAQMEGKTPEEKAESIARAATLVPLWTATGGMTMLPQVATWIGGDELAAAAARAAGRQIGKGKNTEPAAEDLVAMRQGGSE